MSTDPFNIVKEELKKTINKTKSLIESYNVVSKSGNDDSSQKLLNEIRTNLRSINWDLQDLDETIEIASKNPSKFNLTGTEIDNRKDFIIQTKDFLQRIKQSYNIDLDKSSANLTSLSKKPSNSNNINIRIPDLISNTTKSNDNDDSDYELDTRKGLFNNNDKNVKFNLNESSNNKYVSLQMQHEDIFKEQEKNLELISTRVSSLKNISQTMQNELDDQANLLEDMGREMDTAESRMQTVMKKITKVLHLGNDRRQWTMIGILLLAIFIVIILFAVLP